MATLRFPYEPGGFLTVKTDRVIDVTASGTDMILETDLVMGAGQVMTITLTYKTAQPTSTDVDLLLDAIVEAAQTPGSCEIFRLTGDDQSAGFALNATTGTEVTSA